jgi:hypothetical protein
VDINGRVLTGERERPHQPTQYRQKVRNAAQLWASIGLGPR